MGFNFFFERIGTYLQSEEVRVVCLWCQRAHSTSEVIHVVLPPPSSSALPCGVRTHAYLITSGRAHGAPDRIRELFERLRPNCIIVRSNNQGTNRTHARTERGIVVPPDVALRTAHEHSRRCCRVTFFIAIIKKGSSSKAMNVYALEGISVLCVCARCYRIARRGRVFFLLVPFRGSLRAK